MAWPPVSPAAAIERRAAARRSPLSCRVGRGAARSTSSQAASSSSSPVGRPSASQTTSAAWSNVRGPSTPASSSARGPSSAEWASKSWISAGTSSSTGEREAEATGASPKVFGSRPQARSQAPGASFRTSAARASRTPARFVQPDRSSPPVISAPVTGWMWPSTRPGVTTAPLRSITVVEASASARISRSSPRATVRPPETASAVSGRKPPVTGSRRRAASRTSEVRTGTPGGRSLGGGLGVYGGGGGGVGRSGGKGTGPPDGRRAERQGPVRPAGEDGRHAPRGTRFAPCGGERRRVYRRGPAGRPIGWWSGHRVRPA